MHIGWKPWKWHNIRPSNWGTDTPFDQPYIRYADVLLMYAEAKNGQGILSQADIDNTVNLIRSRARQFPDGVVMPQTIAEDMVLADLETNANEILSERRKELCLEGWRRNDLVRFGKYQQGIRVTQPSWSNSGNPQDQFSDFEEQHEYFDDSDNFPPPRRRYDEDDQFFRDGKIDERETMAELENIQLEKELRRLEQNEIDDTHNLTKSTTKSATDLMLKESKGRDTNNLPIGQKKMNNSIILLSTSV